MRPSPNVYVVWIRSRFDGKTKLYAAFTSRRAAEKVFRSVERMYGGIDQVWLETYARITKRRPTRRSAQAKEQG